MRVVLDTNVLISGIFWSGLPRNLLLRWQEKAFELLISPPILDEYQRVAEDMRKKHSALMDVRALLDLIVVNSLLVQPKKGPVPACDDPNDVMFLQAAISGKARFIISGDHALLRVGRYPGGRVVSPKIFWSELSK